MSNRILTVKESFAMFEAIDAARLQREMRAEERARNAARLDRLARLAEAQHFAEYLKTLEDTK